MDHTALTAQAVQVPAVVARPGREAVVDTAELKPAAGLALAGRLQLLAAEPRPPAAELEAPAAELEVPAAELVAGARRDQLMPVARVTRALTSRMSARRQEPRRKMGK